MDARGPDRIPVLRGFDLSAAVYGLRGYVGAWGPLRIYLSQLKDQNVQES